jgi:hypothetical protein
MKHVLEMKMRSFENFEDIQVDRVIDYELRHNNEEVLIKESSWESILEANPWLIPDQIMRTETYMTLEGNKIYRGWMDKPDGSKWFFFFEKVL